MLSGGQAGGGPGGAIVGDGRRCAGCGYDLAGLRLGGACPECGTRIMSVGRTSEGTLADAPTAYLRTLQRGCTLLLVALVGAAATMLLAWAARELGAPWLALGVCVPALAWVGAVWMMTAPRRISDAQPQPRVQEWWLLRRVVRTTQVFWLPMGAAGALWLWTVVSNAQLASAGVATSAVVESALAWAKLAGLGAMAVAVAGLPWFGVYLTRLADWAGDEGLARWLGSASVGAVVGAVLVGMVLGLGTLLERLWTGAIVGTVLGLLLVVGGGLLLVSAGVLLFATMRFTDTARWAGRHGEIRLARAAWTVGKSGPAASPADDRAPGRPRRHPRVDRSKARQGDDEHAG